MTGKSKRGFASMDRDRQRAIAAKGGKAAHAKGTAHVWTAAEAREAGRKGGEAVSQDRSHMSAIGKEGGESRSAGLRAARANRTQEQQFQRAASSGFLVTGDREVPLPLSVEGAAPAADFSERLAASAPLSEGLADVRSSVNVDDMADVHPPEHASATPARAGAASSAGSVRPALEQRSST